MSSTAMLVMRWVAFGLIAVLIAGLVLAAALYFRDMGAAYRRIAGQSEMLPVGDGAVDFTHGGSGPPVLVIHGSGGGFDQGALIAGALLGDGFHWIAPSRFGYLRSSVPAGASFDAQANVYVKLLDHLGISRVAVVALSHGGPSALLLALLHPQRVSSLTLVSCGVASSSEAAQAGANRKGDALTTIFSHDPLYWAVSSFLRRPLVTLMGASADVLAQLAPDRRRLVDQLIDEMNPVAPRSAGVAFDNRAALPNERIGGIRAPTLILHARDDTLQLFRHAEFAAATIPGARLLSFERGGHLLLAVELDRLRAEVQAFVRAHGGP